jgi:hypothetical protein
MLVDILKSIMKDFQQFIVVWAVVILVNQIVIFGACFKVYCLVAALPHTFVISALAHYFMKKEQDANGK